MPEVGRFRARGRASLPKKVRAEIDPRGRHLGGGERLTQREPYAGRSREAHPYEPESVRKDQPVEIIASNAAGLASLASEPSNAAGRASLASEPGDAAGLASLARGSDTSVTDSFLPS